MIFSARPRIYEDTTVRTKGATKEQISLTASTTVVMKPIVGPTTLQ